MVSEENYWTTITIQEKKIIISGRVIPGFTIFLPGQTR